MKKSSKILGSIALSAALVMGTAAPAFADATGEEAPTTMGADTTTSLEFDATSKQAAIDGGTAGGSSTVIQASTYTSQLSVTVPLSVPLKFDTVGGEGLAPSNDAYYIQNNSTTTNITVIKADFTASSPTAWDFADNYVATSTMASNPVGSVTVGDFYLGIDPTITNLKKADGTPVTAGTTAAKLELKANGTNRTSGNKNLNWGIKPGQKFGFALQPSSSKLKMNVDTAANIAAITYTVGVGLSTDAITGDSPVPPAPTAMSLADLKSAYTTAGATINNIYLGTDNTGTPIMSQDATYDSSHPVTVNGYAIYNTGTMDWDSHAGAPASIQSGATYRLFVSA